MGLAYLFALIVGLGALLVQIAVGARGHDMGHGIGHAVGHAHDPASHPDDFNLLTLFLSLRFWIFFLFAFGFAGGLLHLFGLSSPVATLAIATAAGLLSGVFAVLALRAVARSGGPGATSDLEAIGKTGRVLIPCGPTQVGQIRVELTGQSVDLRAISSDGDIARGEPVVIEDVDDGVARVSRGPRELS